jgi:hypothetical protein
MPNDPSTSSRRPSWRLLVLDRSEPDDTRWLIATVAEPGDVRPAGPSDTPDDVTRAWAGGTLTALRRARVWRIDESPAPGS